MASPMVDAQQSDFISMRDKNYSFWFLLLHGIYYSIKIDKVEAFFILCFYFCYYGIRTHGVAQKFNGLA